MVLGAPENFPFGGESGLFLCAGPCPPVFSGLLPLITALTLAAVCLTAFSVAFAALTNVSVTGVSLVAGFLGATFLGAAFFVAASLGAAFLAALVFFGEALAAVVFFLVVIVVVVFFLGAAFFGAAAFFAADFFSTRPTVTLLLAAVLGLAGARSFFVLALCAPFAASASCFAAACSICLMRVLTGRVRTPAVFFFGDAFFFGAIFEL